MAFIKEQYNLGILLYQTGKYKFDVLCNKRQLVIALIKADTLKQAQTEAHKFFDFMCTDGITITKAKPRPPQNTYKPRGKGSLFYFGFHEKGYKKKGE